MVKPANEGSSIGMTQATTAEELQVAIDKAFEYDHEVLIEQWVTGREYTVSILGKEALPVIEMRTPHQFYDYEAKYKSGDTEYLCPAPIDGELTNTLQSVALRAFRLLGASGWGRVDFLVSEEGDVNVLEVNTVPGMTETSLVPKAAKAKGLNFDQLVSQILLDSGK
jgi:D-alanine-D-alanine ligase